MYYHRVVSVEKGSVSDVMHFDKKNWLSTALAMFYA